MLLIFIRTIILYALVLIIMRKMGKRQIGQLQPFELTIAIMIADLASTPLSNPGISIINGIIPIIALLIAHIIISVINLKSITIREFICGKPRILIYRGKIDEQALKKEKFTVNELQERLRSNNIVSLSDVEYAILETSGQITVIPKPEKKALTPQDLNIEVEYEGIPYDLIVDGRIMEQNLKKIGKDMKWLENQLKGFKLKPKEVLIATIDGKGQFFCQERERKND